MLLALLAATTPLTVAAAGAADPAVTSQEDVPTDDHDQPVPVEWRARAGSMYVGKITATGTSTGSGGVTNATFSIVIQGRGSEGERFSLHYLSHATEKPMESATAAFEKNAATARTRIRPRAINKASAGDGDF